MKIFVFGPVGSGKTYLSKKLARLLHIPLHELDHDFFSFEKGNAKNMEKRINHITCITHKDSWIIEGMYQDPWVKDVISRADIVLILLPSRLKRSINIINRTMRRMLHLEKYERESTIPLLIQLLHMSWSFETERLEEFLSWCESNAKTPVVIKTSEDVFSLLENFLI